MNQSKTIFDFTNYMTIEALEDGVSVFCGRYVQYGIDGVGWKDSSSEIIINTGQLLSIKCELSQGDVFGTIEINGRCNLKGNCLSLIFGNKAKNNNDLSGYSKVFEHLFYSNDGILNIEKTFLPATTLDTYCYDSMFYGCTNLTTSPELPSTTLMDYCYNRMFEGCTSLVTAPELPATTLKSYCYLSMFEGCTSLTTAPELPATTLVYSCYHRMFYGCSKLNYIKAMFTTEPTTMYDNYTMNWVSGVASTGTFVKNKDATWFVTGASGIPVGWDVVFEECVFKLVDINNLIILNNQPFDEGMTWQEFANSDYNIDNKLKISSYGTVVYDGRPVKDKAEPVSLNDIIKPTNYLLDAYGSGGSGGGN